MTKKEIKQGKSKIVFGILFFLLLLGGILIVYTNLKEYPEKDLLCKEYFGDNSKHIGWGYNLFICEVEDIHPYLNYSHTYQKGFMWFTKNYNGTLVDEGERKEGHCFLYKHPNYEAYVIEEGDDCE